MFIVPTLEQIRQSILRDYQSLDPSADISVDSDNYARASALAAVAEGVYAHQKWLAKQFFPDTADTEFLEKHAALRGLRRKTATFASGIGCATVQGQPNATVAEGVQIKTEDNRFYITTKSAVLNSQGLALVDVRALNAGASHNIYAPTKAIFMTVPRAVQSELTLNQVVGGTNAESDRALLARLLEKIRRPAAGGNRYDYKNWALEVDGVEAAYVYPLRNGLGTVDIAIASNNDLPSDDTVRLCQAYIDEVRPVTAKESRVIKPDVVRVNFTIQVKLANVSLTEMQQTIHDALAGYFNNLSPGQDLILSQCEAIVSDLIGVVDRRITSPSANKIANVQTKIEWFRLGNVNVSLMGA